jgi:2-dehydro-3-deoxyglucarate aldolase/4-hydroxy-2-oxoheptanedioate aldolase
MTRHRRPKFGTYVIEFDTPGMGHICRAAGCDFVIIDMEHSGFTYDQLKRMLRHYQAADLPVIVNTPMHDDDMIARACDMGADGIQPSKVGSAEEARAIVARMRYPPKGHRGVALGIAHDRYRPGAVDSKLRAANREVVFFPKIETLEGVENIEKIAALPDVAGIWIGHFDLSVGMGIPAEFEHPAYRAAMKRVSEACRRHQVSLGRIADNPKNGRALNRAGFDFLCYSGDSWLLRDGLKRALDALRDQCRPTGATRHTGVARGRREAGCRPATR